MGLWESAWKPPNLALTTANPREPEIPRKQGVRAGDPPHAPLVFGTFFE